MILLKFERMFTGRSNCCRGLGCVVNDWKIFLLFATSVAADSQHSVH